MAALGFGTVTARAHGFEAGRFFPPTIQTDDPFATDELSFPTISTFKNAGSPEVRNTSAGFEFDKEIFPKFAVGVSDDVQHLTASGQKTVTGFDNLSFSAKYQLWEVPEHEAILSVGCLWEVGGTGSKKIGADSNNVFTPTIYYGKGFGDLPDALNYVKPFAITGTVGEDIPTGGESNNLEWGFAIEYSLPYLQSEVKDIGLPHPFRDLIPLVEFALTTPENRGGGPTTGTINPGVLYETTYYQFGAEAILPVNHATGSGVGFVVQLQIFIDDIFPKTFGHALFGKDQ